ncbi:MAG: translocation/assembly module TamB [Bacteroidales bacterium]|nr:translocation/assembly module TamB [Bacteroidales bacterium]
MLKKIVKYLVLTFGLLLIVLIGLLAYTQTALFREFLRVKVLKIANPHFNGELAIGKIEGNLYNTIHLADVALSDSDSTVVNIDSLYVNYRLGDLRAKHFIIDTLYIQSLNFNLWYQDSTTLHLLYVLDKLITKSGDKPSEFPLILDVRSVVVENGRGSYQLRYGIAPVDFEGININARGYFKEKHVEVELHSMTVHSSHPDLELEQGRLSFLKKGPLLRADSIYLKTKASLLTGGGRYASGNDFEIDIEASPLDKGDFQKFLPKIPLRSIPRLTLRLESEQEDVYCDLLLEKGQRHVGLKGVFSNLPEALLRDSLVSEYNAGITFNGFVPEEWFDISKTDAYLNGSLSIDGVNVFDYKSDLNIQARFNNSSYRKTVADTLHIDAIQVKNDIKADMLVVYNKSHSEGHLKIRDLYNKPVYTANFITRNLDIEAIEPTLENTIVNGHIIVSGTHIISNKRSFTTRAELFDSKVYNIDVDTLVLSSDLSGASLQIDTLAVVIEDNEVLSSGVINLSSYDFEAETKVQGQNLDFLEQFEFPKLALSKGVADVTMSGNIDSIKYSGDVEVLDLAYKSLNCDTISARLQGQYKIDSLTIGGKVNGVNLFGPIQYLNSFDIDFSYADKQLWSLINLEKDNVIDAQLDSELNINDTIDLTLASAEIKLPGSHFYLTDSKQNIKFHNNSILIDEFEVKDFSNKDFRLKADGSLSASNVENFALDIDSLNLNVFNHFIESTDSIGGRLSMALKVVGEPESASLKGKYFLKDFYYRNIATPILEGQLSYLTDTFSVNTWSPELDSSVYAHVKVPVNLKIDSSGYDIKMPETFMGELIFDSLEVVTPDIPEYEHMNAGLFLDGVIKARGDFNKPMVYGQVNMADGYINNDKQGVYYKDITGQFVFDENRINIDTFYVGSDKGYYSSKGHLLFDSTLISGKVIASDMSTSIQKFHVVQHKNYDVNISGNPHYRTGEKGVPRFGGKVIVNRSSFYIPGLVTDDGSTNGTENLPLLVEAIQEIDSIDGSTEPKEVELVPPFIKQLRGRLNIDIPRSTWLKSNDMNIEISGDVDVVKEADYFELFGDVEIVRGHYILYGRKFSVNEGVITFMGGETQDPRLEISAEYVFRGSDKEKHTLQLSISEYLSEPEIDFTLDDVGITQSDAVSIMIFGKTMDELSYDGQNGIIGSVGSNMLANMVTSSLNSTIGQRFKLDMIEVNSTENWQSAAFVVGKYITNDLFVIYQRGFGETEDDEITPETITLEYELNKVLFFRLQSGSSKTSGFDVILKFESSK